MRDYVLLYINGKRHQISGERVFQPLSDFLRYDQEMVGTKVVCAEGDCGACSALLGRAGDGTLNYQVFNTCIAYVFQLDCRHVVTVEGLKGHNGLHPVQQAMIEHFGSQCGYCTPGFVVAMAALFEKRHDLTEQAVRDGLTGNLCRCTGYQAIINATLSIKPDTVETMAERFPALPMLDAFDQHSQSSVLIEYPESIQGKTIMKRSFIPSSVQEAVLLKKQHPDAVLIAGGTDISVQMNKEKIDPQTVIILPDTPELRVLELDQENLKIGAKVRWSELEIFCKDKLPELHKILKVFASDQIKNCATMAGNIANASPIADSLPFLFVVNAEIELTGIQNKRWVEINRFFHGYKNTDIQAEEVITQIRIPLPKPEQFLKLYKVSKRRDLDISTFTAAILVEMVDDQMIKDIRIAYGGVAPVVLRLAKTEAFLKNKTFDLENMRTAGKLAREEIAPISDVRASRDYRLRLSETTLEKFFHEVSQTE
ncbi:MAG: FAD binding domain-containing protein [SAR324 cluster bacterium]|nr:FAD binding domain-containing protein [SAR324 cluster bacterium]